MLRTRFHVGVIGALIGTISGTIKKRLVLLARLTLMEAPMIMVEIYDVPMHGDRARKLAPRKIRWGIDTALSGKDDDDDDDVDPRLTGCRPARNYAQTSSFGKIARALERVLPGADIAITLGTAVVLNARR